MPWHTPVSTLCAFVAMAQMCKRAVFENGLLGCLPRTSWAPEYPQPLQVVFSGGVAKAAQRGLGE